jgi:hypothetical protein
MPTSYYANTATEMIFAASAERLGKGSVFKGISKAFNRAITPVSKIVNAVSSTVTSVATTGIQDLGGMINGVDNAATRGVTGFANQVANMASSPAAVGMVAGALGDEGALGSLDTSGMQQATAGQWNPGPVQSPSISPQVLEYGALAIGGVLVLYLAVTMMNRGGRRR